MKKILLVMLACMCMFFAGCSYGGAGFIQNSNGSLSEFYYVPFPEAELINLGKDPSVLRELLLNVKDELDTTIFQPLIDAYQQRVAASNKYTLKEKTQLVKGVKFVSNLPEPNEIVVGTITQIEYEIFFDNSDCYVEFKNANEFINEKKEVIVENHFFTTVTKVVKDPMFNNISKGAVTIGQNCIKKVNNVMATTFGEADWEQTKQLLNYNKYASKFNYTYVVPTARVHTNAQTTVKKSNGYYYHTWELDVNNVGEDGEPIIKIEYYTVKANKWIWYVLILLASGTIATIVYLIAKKKEQKEQEKFKAE